MTLYGDFLVYGDGGGVNSVAVALAQIEGLIKPFDVYVFANTGHDSENPRTLEYRHKYIIPLYEKHGIRYEEVATTRKKNTVLSAIEADNKSIPIPAFFADKKKGKPTPAKRACTVDYKIIPIDRWIRAQGYKYVTVGLGFTLEEGHRTRLGAGSFVDYDGDRKLGFWKNTIYPLIYPLGFNRLDCHAIIARHGLPSVPKSSCVFCPNFSKLENQELKKTDVELWKIRVETEQKILQKRADAGHAPMYLTPTLKPLDEAVSDQQTDFFDLLECQDTSCNT